MKPESLGTTQLYRHFDAEGRLLYVGISLSAIHRLAQHKKTAEWHKNIAKVTVETFETREAALLAETIAIQKENPIYNKQKTSYADKRFQRIQYSDSIEVTSGKVMFFRWWHPIDVICDCVYGGDDWNNLSCEEQEDEITYATENQIVSACFNFSHIAIRGECDLCGRTIDVKEVSKLDFNHCYTGKAVFYCPELLLECVDLKNEESSRVVPERAPARDYFKLGWKRSDFMKWGTWIALNEEATVWM
jgi:hypothetical protein